MEKLEEKIGNNIDLQEISQSLCKNYQLGKYKEHIEIETGIEDFNYCLVTEQKKYLIKIFNKSRKKEEQMDYVKKYQLLEENKIETPRIIGIYKEENRFVVIMEYIEGEDLYSSNESITQEQVKKLMEMMNEIHQIPSKIACIYDDYHIPNFNQSYDLCIPYLDEQWKNIGEELKKRYNEIDFSKMPKSFIHGDLHKGNIMKDKENKLYLIDFASCGYSYHIIDIVQFMNNTLFDYREVERSKKRIDYFIKHYPLTDYEKQNLKVLMKCYAFISFALKQYDFYHAKNQTEESKYWTNNNTAIIKDLKIEEIINDKES